MERALQALVLSQYRLKVFQDHRLAIKPVVLFKAAKIADSKEFMATFLEAIRRLTGAQLRTCPPLLPTKLCNGPLRTLQRTAFLSIRWRQSYG